MEKDKENIITSLNKKVETANKDTKELKSIQHKNECLIAELEYRLAEAQ
jgi:hypothetical protein